MKHVTTVAELNQLKSQNGKVIVDFYATWCGPCVQAGPVFERLAKENPTVTFLKVNIDEAKAISTAYGIQSIPTFITFKDGTQKEKKTGFSEAQVKNMIANL